MDIWKISCEMTLNWWMSQDLNEDKSTLVQAPSHYLKQCWPSLAMLYGVTWTQWVNHFTEFFFEKHEKAINVLDFLDHVSIQYWNGTGCWNPSSLLKARTHLSCIVSIMAGDVLATQGAKASAVMIFTSFFWNIPVSALGGLRCCHIVIDLRSLL